jgi:hypothetical protein
MESVENKTKKKCGKPRNRRFREIAGCDLFHASRASLRAIDRFGMAGPPQNNGWTSGAGLI